MSTLDDLIEILAKMPDPNPNGQKFIYLDGKVPFQVMLPAFKQWIEILTFAQDDFLDSVNPFFSS